MPSPRIGEHVLGVGQVVADLIGVVEPPSASSAATRLRRDSFRSKSALRGSAAARCAIVDPQRPVELRRELDEAMQQPRRQIARAHERDAPHGRSASTSCSARDAARRPGRTLNASLRSRQPMRAQARQPMRTNLPRIQPPARNACRPATRSRKAAVEAHVVGDDIAPANELDQPADDAFHTRLADEHLGGDAG